MTNFLKPFFTYTKSQRIGVVALLSCIVLLHVFYFINLQTPIKEDPEKLKWLALQTELDSMKLSSQQKVRTMYPFNPNFITDYKGYVLGMSVAEIDRLHEFRKQNKYVNSATEFQNLTKVSDSLLATMSPYFKFPEWVTNKKTYKTYQPYKEYAKPKIVVLDINAATAEDLDKVYGIGETLAARIIKMRESLGGFVSMEQMADVYGLSEEVIEKLKEHFIVGPTPQVKKIAINNQSIKELSQFPYFRYTLARQIVTFRSMNGDIKTLDDLTKIKGFPVEKAHIIALYLDF